MMDLSGKSVVYVGGFSGVGYQVCRHLMKKHLSHLVVCGRMENVEMLHKLQEMGAGDNVTFIHVNLMDRVSIEQAVMQIVPVVKHIDVLINGAGVLADKDVETTIAVNLTGMINMTLMCMPYMDKTQKGKGGMVLNISSVYGMEPAPAFVVYGAAKHGVVGFTRSMADTHYYQKTGVAFVCVCPGLTSTEMMVNLRDNVTMHYSEEMVEAITSAKHQTSEECAINVVKAMEMMKNGAIYICNMGQLKEVVPTMHWQI